METQPKHKLLVLENHVLVKAAQNDRIAKQFSFMIPIKAANDAVGGGKCTPCRKRQQQTALLTAIENAKAAISTLPDDRKKLFKELLEAERVRFMYTAGTAARQVTF